MTYSPEMEEIPPAPELDGVKACEDSMENYLDTMLYDMGIVGGEIWIRVREHECFLESLFWSRNSLDFATLKKLVENVEGQLSDGIGENGFEHVVNGQRVIVQAILPQKSSVQSVHDGRNVSEPPFLATAVWNGHTEDVRKLIQSGGIDLERRYQFWTPLQLAIKKGGEEAVNLLLGAGADATSFTNDWQPHTSLELCALSSSLSDEQSKRVATLLVMRGADPRHVTGGGETALSYAINRRKPELSDYLRELTRKS